MRKAYLIWKNFSMQMKKQNITAYAASIAFFFFLSGLHLFRKPNRPFFSPVGRALTAVTS